MRSGTGSFCQCEEAWADDEVWGEDEMMEERHGDMLTVHRLEPQKCTTENKPVKGKKGKR